jgi:lipopolysaccharide transport system permease protein
MKTANITTDNAPEGAGGFDRVIQPQRGLVALNFKELWRFRELFWFLAWRDILVRYKQTYLGVAWAILQPVLTTIIFVLLSRVAKFPTNGAPVTVLIFAALLPWQLFSNALTESSNSLVSSARIISKVYFPRLIVPASAVLSGTLDFLIGIVILTILMLIYGLPLNWHLLLLPVFFAQCFLTAFAVGVWLSALNVKYRDVRYIVPFFTRIGLYVSPVWFIGKLVVPERLHMLYFSLNPMAGVIEGFRWCVLGPGFEPFWPGFWVSLVVTLILLVTGLIYFRQTEKTFADVI